MDLEEIYDILSSIQMGMRDKRNLAQLLFKGLDGQGTTDYNNLHNIPSINNIPLKGKLTLEKLGFTDLIKAIDNLTSNDKINALSANQGRILNNKIFEIITQLNQIKTDLNDKADSATTLAGYGINDAYTKQQVINLINEAIEGLEQTGGKEYGLATHTSDGLMSKEDKIKLDGINNRVLSNSTRLESSTYNALGEITADITFTINLYDYIAEYSGEFSFGDTVYNITFPSSVVWAVEPVYQPNRKYQFSILNNLGIMCEFPLNN